MENYNQGTIPAHYERSNGQKWRKLKVLTTKCLHKKHLYVMCQDYQGDFQWLTFFIFLIFVNRNPHKVVVCCGCSLWPISLRLNLTIQGLCSYNQSPIATYATNIKVLYLILFNDIVLFDVPQLYSLLFSLGKYRKHFRHACW